MFLFNCLHDRYCIFYHARWYNVVVSEVINLNHFSKVVIIVKLYSFKNTTYKRSKNTMKSTNVNTLRKEMFTGFFACSLYGALLMVLQGTKISIAVF